MANILTNGDFELGNTGFNDEFYQYPIHATHSNPIPSTAPPPPYYAIGTDPSVAYGEWSSFGDHTSGSGNMFMALPAGTTSSEQVYIDFTSLTVLPQTDYYVSFYVKALQLVSFPNVQISCQLRKEDVSLGYIDSQTVTWDANVSSWTFFDTILNTGNNTEVRLRILPITDNQWALDDVVMDTYNEDIEESSSSSSESEDFLLVEVPPLSNVTYFSYLNGPKEISNPLINNSTGMRFGGYLDATEDSPGYDSFGYGLDKTVYNYGSIWCDDASTLCSMKRGYVKMALNFDEALLGGHTGLTGTPNHNEYILWGVNVSQFGIETGGIGAKLSFGGLDFEVKSSKGDFVLSHNTLELEAGEDIVVEFVWELGGMFDGSTMMIAVDGIIVEASSYAFAHNASGENFNNLAFYCLNSPFGHSDLTCTIKHLQVGDGVPEEFKQISEESTSSSSSSFVEEEGGPGIGSNQPIIIFGFIDESDPYFDPSVRAADVVEFDEYFDEFPPRTGSKFTCFAVRPCPTIGISPESCDTLFPGPSIVVEDEMQRSTVSEWTKMQAYFDQAVADMGLNSTSDFFLFFSIDNSGSMTDADVRDAIDQMIGYAEINFPHCVVDDTFGSRQERWIRDMLFAYQTLGVE